MTPLQKARIEEICMHMSAEKLDGIRRLILILKDTPKIPEPEEFYRQGFYQKAEYTEEFSRSVPLKHQKADR